MKKNILITFPLIVLATLFITPCFAKRGPLPVVAPIIIGDIAYETVEMGVLVAKEVASGKELWRKKYIQSTLIR